MDEPGKRSHVWPLSVAFRVSSSQKILPIRNLVDYGLRFRNWTIPLFNILWKEGWLWRRESVREFLVSIDTVMRSSHSSNRGVPESSKRSFDHHESIHSKLIKFCSNWSDDCCDLLSNLTILNPFRHDSELDSVKGVLVPSPVQHQNPNDPSLLPCDGRIPL